jgi:glycosyltransferase involved in cell wall biosynthesis
MWHTDHPVEPSLKHTELSQWRSISWRAIFQLPMVALKFASMIRRLGREGSLPELVVFTHYATLPLTWFVPRARRYIFVQDLEWKFLRSGPLSWLVRSAILFFYRRSHVIAANSYLRTSFVALGVPVKCEIPIWADAAFLVEEPLPAKDIDFAMILRKGHHKRLDLYLAFIALVRELGTFRIAVISTEDEIIELVRSKVSTCEVRPSLERMRSLYLRAKCFVHLSDHEGFGLPPLEAMGAGCVPLCRDSGGIRAFMHGEVLETLLFPLSMPIDEVASRAVQTVGDVGRLDLLSRHCRLSFRAGLDVQQRRAAAIDGLLREATVR